MQHVSKYNSPLGDITLAADEVGLIGVWFEGQKYFGECLSSIISRKDAKTQRAESEAHELPIFDDTKRWLDVYFSGKDPDFDVPVHLIGTEFQKQVWEILRTIPYGKTLTYKEIARRIVHDATVEGDRATNCTTRRMSAQAVGNAVGRNNISIIIPCHRVIGTNGSLTGYAGGLDRKQALLALEQNF